MIEHAQRNSILKGLNDRLKEHGTLLRRVVPDTELMRKAINGNAGAMRKLRSETKKYISEQKVLNKNSTPKRDLAALAALKWIYLRRFSPTDALLS